MTAPNRYPAFRLILPAASLVWITAVLWPSVMTWFDWETVRFFVIPRPSRYRWLESLTGNWVDLSDYGITVASQTLRPLMAWSFQIETLLFDSWAPGYHMVNLLAHMVCAWLLFRFLHRNGIDFRAAWLAAMFFALHPLSTQPLWILVDRAETFVLIGGLIVLIAYPARPLLAAGGLLLALLSKETAVTIPAWLVAWEFLGRVPEPLPTPLAKRIRPLIPLFLIVMLYVLYRWLVFSGIGGYRAVNHARFDHLADVMLQNIAWLCAVPHPRVWVTLLFLILATACLTVSRISRFSLVWMCLFLLPVHNLSNKWYLYVPVAAFAVCLAGGIHAALRSPAIARPVCFSGLTVVAGLSVLSHAELLHQRRNAEVPVRIAARVSELHPDLPRGARIRFALAPPLRTADLRGHFIDPSKFEVRKFKTPIESIVWDLNATRYVPDGRPVWTRSVEAALQLLYDDIGIRAALADPGTPDPPGLPSVTLSYEPASGSLNRVE